MARTQRLYVTPKIVETHIRHIFTKLSLPETALDNKRVHAVLTYLRAWLPPSRRSWISLILPQVQGYS